MECKEYIGQVGHEGTARRVFVYPSKGDEGGMNIVAVDTHLHLRCRIGTHIHIKDALQLGQREL